MDLSELQEQLWLASECGDLSAIRSAVIKGADVELRDNKERNAINIASQYGHAEALQTLLAAKSMARLERLGLPLFPSKKAAESIQKTA